MFYRPPCEEANVARRRCHTGDTTRVVEWNAKDYCEGCAFDVEPEEGDTSKHKEGDKPRNKGARS